MAIVVRPATVFEDVEAVLGPQRPDASVCWCLSYRLTSSKENRELVGPARGERVRQLVQQVPPPGVLAYENGDVVGWAAVHPRADTSFARDNGAVAIEGYPLDNNAARIDTTMAYVGTVALFEKAGFTKVADTDSVLDGFPRVLVRLDLR